MVTKNDLCRWVVDAIRAKGGTAAIVEVAEEIWANHEADLRLSDRLFYTWQYDMRWCALELRKAGTLAPASKCPIGVWALQP